MRRVARAQEVTLRRLMAEVEWALEARDGILPTAPPAAGATLVLPERQMRAHREPEGVDTEITFWAAASVVALFRTALVAFKEPHEPLWRGCERLLDHVTREWEAQPPHRDPIFARDGWRCAVPACSSRRNLHDHHIAFRSQGGGNARDNRLGVCAWNHRRGSRRGRGRASGRAPDRVVWELGGCRGWPPVLCTVGDRYLKELTA